MEQDRWPNYEEGYLAVEKRLTTVTKLDGDQFNTSSDNWLHFVVFLHFYK